MVSQHSTAPPTEPRTTPDLPPEQRLARLERRSRLLLIGLIICAALVVTMTAFNGVLLSRYGTMLAEQRVQERAQFELLEQLRDDFETFEIEVPRNRLEAYGELREQLNILKDFYGGIADYDVTDPEGSLDRILGQEPRERRRSGDETPVAPPQEDESGGDGQSTGG